MTRDEVLAVVAKHLAARHASLLAQTPLPIHPAGLGPDSQADRLPSSLICIPLRC